MYHRDQKRYAELEGMGSALYGATDGAILAAASAYHDMYVDNPELRAFVYADSIIVTNNSAQPIEFWLNNSELYRIPAYTIQPIMRRPATNYRIVNAGSAATNASEIRVQYRRLPPDIVRTVIVQ